MTEDQTIKTVNALLLAAFMFISQAILTLPYALDDHKPKTKPHAEKYEVYLQPAEAKPARRPNAAIIGEAKLRNTWAALSITYTTVEYEYLGRYFITAYCPAECGGSWQTSSGATCHYSDDWATPTTCAIDRRYHGYNEFLMVGEPGDPNRKVYQTEDTGPGVRGLWIDCFVETMDEVQSWPTRWDSVYRVEYITKTLDKNERMARHERLNNCLHYRSFGPGFSFWNDPRVND